MKYAAGFLVGVVCGILVGWKPFPWQRTVFVYQHGLYFPPGEYNLTDIDDGLNKITWYRRGTQ